MMNMRSWYNITAKSTDREIQLRQMILSLQCLPGDHSEQIQAVLRHQENHELQLLPALLAFPEFL